MVGTVDVAIGVLKSSCWFLARRRSFQCCASRPSIQQNATMVLWQQ